MRNVQSCFFPTTVILVDDDPNILHKIEKLLAKTHIVCKSFTNPNEALNYVYDGNCNKLNFCNMLRDGECDTSEEKSALLIICGIYKEIYDPYRFLKISAVISDYYMPEMNGPDFCESLCDRNIQRILLTDKAEDYQAICEFNKNNITSFIRKDAKDFDNEIVERVNIAVYQHFSLYTQQVKTFLRDDGGHLVDKIFSESIFANLWHSPSRKFVEYYMIDPYGGYLLLDADGKAGMLSVCTESEFDKLIEIAVDAEADQEVIEKLKSRKYILVFHSRIGMLPPVNEWKNYLRPAQQCHGVYQNYYFFIDEFGSNVKLDLDFDKIASYNQFKMSQIIINQVRDKKQHYYTNI